MAHFMTNREQITAMFENSDIDDFIVAETICEIIDAVGGCCWECKKAIEKFLALKCDENYNWGKLNPCDRVDYEDFEEDEDF